MRYTWASATDVGHVREQNEDSVHPDVDGHGPGPLVVAVADGMGGAAAGEVASQLAIEAATADDLGELAAGPRVLRGNEAVLDAVRVDGDLIGMGTTLTLGIFHEDGMLELGHVGDTRAYLLRASELRQLTRDHTLVADMVAQGKLTETQAETHPRRHLLTRVIGMEGIISDVMELELIEGDRIMLCSDGLTGMVDDHGIARLMKSAVNPTEAAWLLVEAANTAGGLDNVTVAVVDVSGP